LHQRAVQVKEGGRRQLVADAWANVRFRLRGSTDEDTHALRDRISRSLEGTRVRDLERLGADVLAGVLPRIYPQMLAVAHEHQDAGRRVYIGSRFSEVVDGVYTGRPGGRFIYRSGKALAIEELAQREGLELERCYAYSDSESDLPMLRVVGHPVAVNPDQQLRRVAREEGWEVLRFDRLGRRLKTAVALAGAAAAGGAGSAALVARARGDHRGRAVRRLYGRRTSLRLPSGRG
jgi:phosphoserine phosphatase